MRVCSDGRRADLASKQTSLRCWAIALRALGPGQLQATDVLILAGSWLPQVDYPSLPCKRGRAMWSMSVQQLKGFEAVTVAASRVERCCSCRERFEDNGEGTKRKLCHINARGAPCLAHTRPRLPPHHTSPLRKALQARNRLHHRVAQKFVDHLRSVGKGARPSILAHVQGRN